MKTTTKKVVLGVLSLSLCSAFGLGIKAFVGNVSAEESPVFISGASIRIQDYQGQDSIIDGMRFKVELTETQYNNLDSATDTVGVLMFPNQLIPVGEELTVETSVAGKTLVNLSVFSSEVNAFKQEDGKYVAYAYINEFPNMDAAYRLGVAVRAYVTEDSTAPVYSNQAVRSYEGVAYAALTDVKDAKEGKYINVTADGKYSPYTETQRADLQALLTEYSVTLKNGDETISENKVTYGEKVVPPACQQAGYTFVWKTSEGEEFDFNTPVKEDIVLTASLEEQKMEMTACLSEATTQNDQADSLVDVTLDGYAAKRLNVSHTDSSFQRNAVAFVLPSEVSNALNVESNYVGYKKLVFWYYGSSTANPLMTLGHYGLNGERASYINYPLRLKNDWVRYYDETGNEIFYASDRWIKVEYTITPAMEEFTSRNYFRPQLGFQTTSDFSSDENWFAVRDVYVSKVPLAESTVETNTFSAPIQVAQSTAKNSDGSAATHYSITHETVEGVQATKFSITNRHINADNFSGANLWRHAVLFGPYADFYGNLKTDVAFVKQYNTLVIDLYASVGSNAAVMFGIGSNRYDLGVENTAVKYYDLNGNQTNYEEGKWLRVVVDLSALVSSNGDHALLLLGVSAENSYIAVSNAFYSMSTI